jgi:hypothetical protein
VLLSTVICGLGVVNESVLTSIGAEVPGVRAVVVPLSVTSQLSVMLWSLSPPVGIDTTISAPEGPGSVEVVLVQLAACVTVNGPTMVFVHPANVAPEGAVITPVPLAASVSTRVELVHVTVPHGAEAAVNDIPDAVPVTFPVGATVTADADEAAARRTVLARVARATLLLSFGMTRLIARSPKSPC